MKIRLLFAFITCSFILSGTSTLAQKSHRPYTIAYYTGDANNIHNFRVDQLSHIIYSFLHLKGDSLHFGNENQKTILRGLTALKQKHPQLRVLIALGGWGGCAPCSDVFSNQKGRSTFAQSVKQILTEFNADGIDIDWEYPTIEGYPGHQFAPEAKDNFTALMRTLRQTLGKKKDITFAAGGFTKFLEESVDWKAVMPYTSWVNLMTYDLVSGYSKLTGHHTALYSNPDQKESTDNCVQNLIAKGVDRKKLVVGAAFYARVWRDVDSVNNGKYRSGVFDAFVAYRDIEKRYNAENGYSSYVDEQSKAPFRYSPTAKRYATFDDKTSIRTKAQYILDQKLGGIMFWELSLDETNNGLLQTIADTFSKK